MVRPRYDEHGLHINRRFLLETARETVGDGRILDFGCSDASGIQWGLRESVDVVGVDIQPIVEHPSLHICTPTTLPFADSSFDAIVSNMVFEHVMHPAEVLSELNRVLRPGGVMLHMWPSNEAIFEGHCRLFFAQNLRSERYLQLCHMLGFGIRRQKKRTSKEFAEKWLRYMDEQCNYLSRPALTQLFHDAGFSFEHRERDYLRYRLGSAPMLAGRLLQKLTTMVVLSRRLTEQHIES